VDPLQAYRAAKTSVDADDRAKVLVKALELLIEKIDVVKMAVTKKNFQLKFSELTKISQAIQILNASLDMTYGEIPKNLSLLYDYLIRTLRSSHLDADTKTLDECRGIMVSLYEGFSGAYKAARKQDNNRPQSARMTV
jgi:flagellar protein FliS